MDRLQAYYDEHAQQARQHEDQRERAINIILSIAGLLVGLITFSQLSVWSLPASLALIALGVFGFLFAGKHYERVKFHNRVMRDVRRAMDKEAKHSSIAIRTSLSDIRSKAEQRHFEKFSWYSFGHSDPKTATSDDPLGQDIDPVESSEAATHIDYQKTARSWIARRRLHTFWEAVPLMIAVFGILLAAATGVKSQLETAPKTPNLDAIRDELNGLSNK